MFFNNLTKKSVTAREFPSHLNNDVSFLYPFKVTSSVSGNAGNRYHGECGGGTDSRILHRGKGTSWAPNGGTLTLRGGDSYSVSFV